MSAREKLEKWSMPEPNSGCILWIGTVFKGYGIMGSGGSGRAHRVAYELDRGPIPNGMTIDHLCRVRCCVNPRHMEVVSNKENVLRGIGPTAQNSAKSHCKHGHSFDGAYIRPSSKQRVCRLCRAAWKREFRRKRREEK